MWIIKTRYIADQSHFIIILIFLNCSTLQKNVENFFTNIVLYNIDHYLFLREVIFQLKKKKYDNKN